MSIIDIPLSNNLLEQHQEASDTGAEFEAYTPNRIKETAKELTGTVQGANIISGVESLLGQLYTRKDSRLTFIYPEPDIASGEYLQTRWSVRTDSGEYLAQFNDSYDDILQTIGGNDNRFFTIDLSTHNISPGNVLEVEFQNQYKSADVEYEGEQSTFELIVGDVGTLEVEIIYFPFVATIDKIEDRTLIINQTWNQFKNKIPTTIESTDFDINPESTFTDWSISHKINNKRDLYTYLHFGADQMKLVTNIKTDNINFPKIPYSAVFKLYEPLPDDVEEKDKVYVVREILPQKTEVVELVSYEQEDEDVLVLREPTSTQVDSPITQRKTDLKSYDELVTTDGRLRNEIIDKFISGSKQPIDLNIDYTKFDNYINFSSAEKRLKNFKYKIQQIESYTAQSASLVGVTSGQQELLDYDNKIREVKNNFDGYETYLYNVSSSYLSSSMGEFKDASWPKTGTGTYADPYKPVSSSTSAFTNWYGSLGGKTGFIYTASLYDRNNSNRLVNILPPHVKEDVQNNKFLDFIDMVGQQFDELWVYTKAIADITDRQNDLTKGFSDDLIFNLAKSLGWNIQDGKDLIDLSRVGFGQKISGSAYTLYTSGSISSPPEGDVPKEITKRLIANMPYLLKSKGTIGSLKGIMNCYGIPSTILRVREYGGIDNSDQRPSFQISRKFTRALGFSGSQYVETTWVDDTNSGKKPETIEFRFKSISGSDQVLVQKDAKWAIKVKDNGSTDNYGTVSFMLSGSKGYKEISSSLLPVYDGEYYSVMLRKERINTNLFPFPSFETSSLFNPPFITGGGGSVEGGRIKIVSGSGVAKIGTKSLEHKNTRSADAPAISYTYLYRSSSAHSGMSAGVGSVSVGETYTFSAYAKVSASAVDSVGELTLFELDKKGDVVNWGEEHHYPNTDGGIKASEKIGLNESEWKQIQVRKTVKFSNTTTLGVRFNNHKRGSTIYWDDVSFRKNLANSDTIANAFNYELFVKKYDAGLDRIIHSSKAALAITGSSVASQSYNAAWTGSGTLWIGGKTTTPFSPSKLSGSMMEFRLWTEPLNEENFDNHVANPKSYIGNSPSSSYHNLVRRFTFDDNTTLSNGDSLRDTSANQTYTQSGSAHGWGGKNFFQATVDKTKTIVPNHGPNRRISSKIRIENNSLSGSGAGLSRNERWDASSNDFAPIDSPKLGIYFSPTDVINEDIVQSFANLDFNQYLGDPRDNFEQEYNDLKDVSNQYFQKYDGNNSFWDYMHIIKYYDQSVFKQMRRLIPARTKAHLGTLIEGNIFERPKSPVQRSNPSLTEPFYEDTINVGKLETETEHEDSRSLVRIETEYPNYTGKIDSADTFRWPSLYDFSVNDNWYMKSPDNPSDRNFYISGSAKYGGPNYVFSEATGAMATQNRLSLHNKVYSFFYSSSEQFDASSRFDKRTDKNFYYSMSYDQTDLDPEYDQVLAWNRSFYEGVKNTIHTTPDGALPIIVRTSAPTVAVPTDTGISKLKVDDSTKHKS